MPLADPQFEIGVLGRAAKPELVPARLSWVGVNQVQPDALENHRPRRFRQPSELPDGYGCERNVAHPRSVARLGYANDVFFGLWPVKTPAVLKRLTLRAVGPDTFRP